MKIKLGLIGAGHWGENLVRNFVQLGVLDVVCDRNANTLKKIATRFPTVKLTSTFDDLLNDPEISAIVIATPSNTHEILAKRSLKAGKHVYVEKPLARSEQGAIELTTLANEVNLTLMVGHLLLYHPAVNKLKELIAGGKLGKVRFLNSDRRNFAYVRNDTNVVWDLAPHDISMITYILGQDRDPDLLQVQGFSTESDGVTDVAHIDLQFSEGVHAHIHNSWIDPHRQALLTVNGSKKTAVLNDMLPERKLELYSALPDGQIMVEHPVYSSDEPLRLECQHFLECVVQPNKTPLSDGIAGYRVAKLLETAEKLMSKQV